MITRTAPQDYYRPQKFIPQRVHVCLHCGGTCFCLPGLGVACLDCRGTNYTTVWESEVVALRKNIQSHRDIVDALKQIKDLSPEYPPELLSQRRAQIIRLLKQKLGHAGTRPNQELDNRDALEDEQSSGSRL